MHRVDEQGARHRHRRFAAAIPALFLAALALALALPTAASAVTPEYKLTIGVVGHGEVKCRVGLSLNACAAKYPEGAKVRLVALPEGSWEFEEWEGDCAGEAEECELTVGEEDLFATAIFAPPEYPLEVDTFGGSGYGEVECKAGGGEPETCGEYPEGTKVTLVVTEVEEGSKFVEWRGDCSGTGGCSVTMSGPRSVTAIFDLREYLLTVKASGTGSGTVECEVEEGPEECREKYPWETEVTILAIPAPGSTFAACKVDGVSQLLSKCEVEMREPHSVTITFGGSTPEYGLTIAKNGTGTGMVKCKVNGGSATTCASKYVQDTKIELVQSAETGSEFAGWSGDCTGPGTCSLTMNAAHSVTATFNKEVKPTPSVEYTLEVKRGGSGSGSVTNSPAGIDCGPTCTAKFPEGTAVTLTPTPDQGSEFKRWLGGGCDFQATCTTTMNGAKTVEAVFVDAEAAVPIEVSGRARVAKRVAPVRGGKAMVTLRCAGGPCKGRLKLVATVRMGKKRRNLVVGRLSFGLASGAGGTFRIRLTGPPLVRRELVKRGKLRTVVQGSGIVKSTLKLRAPTRRRG